MQADFVASLLQQQADATEYALCMLQGVLVTAVQTDADLYWAILGGDLLVRNVVLPLLLQLVCHADKELCAKVVHTHIAPSISQLSCA